MVKSTTEPRATPEVRERILRAFSERATRSGIRSVVMGELASELRMSATTVYNHFASKGDLVLALVERWANDLAASDAGIAQVTASGTPVERIMRWATAWSNSVLRYSPAFWEDLRRDHPDAARIFRAEIRRWKELGAEQLRPSLRPELNPQVTLSVLDVILTQVSDPRFGERTGTSRQEAIETAIQIWARGALAPPRAALTPIHPPRGKSTQRKPRRSR